MWAGYIGRSWPKVFGQKFCCADDVNDNVTCQENPGRASILHSHDHDDVTCKTCNRRCDVLMLQALLQHTVQGSVSFYCTYASRTASVQEQSSSHLTFASLEQMPRPLLSATNSNTSKQQYLTV